MYDSTFPKDGIDPNVNKIIPSFGCEPCRRFWGLLIDCAHQEPSSRVAVDAALLSAMSDFKFLTQEG